MNEETIKVNKVEKNKIIFNNEMILEFYLPNKYSEELTFDYLSRDYLWDKNAEFDFMSLTFTLNYAGLFMSDKYNNEIWFPISSAEKDIRVKLSLYDKDKKLNKKWDLYIGKYYE